MFKECVKICGLDKGEIESALAPLNASGVGFDIVENCLDARITMIAKDGVDKMTFETVKSKVYNIFNEQVYCAFDESLQSIAGKLLKMNGRVLSVAECIHHTRSHCNPFYTIQIWKTMPYSNTNICCSVRSVLSI